MNKEARMMDFEERFKTVSGLSDRMFYKLYYSHVHPFPLLVLGLNPGGVPDSTYLEASRSFYEQWEHDYVRFRHEPRYAIAAPAIEFLSTALDTRSANTLRQIPTTNIIFRRSQSSNELNLPMSVAFAESRPFLQELIELVGPTAILFVSKTAYGYFSAKMCTGDPVDPEPTVTTPNGKNSTTLFMAETRYLNCLSRKVRMLVTGHPSKYARRAEWRQALDAFRREFSRLGLCPLDSHPAVRTLDRLADHQDID